MIYFNETNMSNQPFIFVYSIFISVCSFEIFSFNFTKKKQKEEANKLLP